MEEEEEEEQDSRSLRLIVKASIEIGREEERGPVERNGRESRLQKAASVPTSLSAEYI